MRDCFLWLMSGLAVIGLGACAAGGGGGNLGDISAGDEPAEGGISEVPNPSAEMASKSGKSLGQLQRGHEVYMLKCGECHHYMLPKNVEMEDWEDSLPKMIKHAGLADSDERSVLDYVIGVKKL